MSSAFPEQPEDAPSFAPTTDFPVTPDQAFDDLESSLEDFPDQVDLVVTAEPPEPIGRSYAFDWLAQRFIPSPRARGPAVTNGVDTLTGWIEKCLRTARGAHPIHPPDYGFDPPSPALIGGRMGSVPADLEQRVRDAVTFHPRVSDIEDFDATFDPDDDWMAVSFVIILDDDDTLPISNATVALGF